LPDNVLTTPPAIDPAPASGPGPKSPHWHVLWTRSHCEQQVLEQLAGHGFDLFFPRMETWLHRSGSRRLRSVPMFPGYLFLRTVMDRSSYIEVRKARGLVAVLGEAWDRLAIVPDTEIDGIRRVVDTHTPALPYPYLHEGEWVRITRGPLADLEGALVRIQRNKGLLVVSVELLGRSVAVEVECTSAVPAADPRTAGRRPCAALAGQRGVIPSPTAETHS